MNVLIHSAWASCRASCAVRDSTTISFPSRKFLIVHSYVHATQDASQVGRSRAAAEARAQVARLLDELLPLVRVDASHGEVLLAVERPRRDVLRRGQLGRQVLFVVLGHQRLGPMLFLQEGSPKVVVARTLMSAIKRARTTRSAWVRCIHCTLPPPCGYARRPCLGRPAARPCAAWPPCPPPGRPPRIVSDKRSSNAEREKARTEHVGGMAAFRLRMGRRTRASSAFRARSAGVSVHADESCFLASFWLNPRERSGSPAARPHMWPWVRSAFA